MIIYLCTPAPLAGVCHYFLIYVLTDYRDLRYFQKEGPWDSEAGAIQSAQGRVQLGDDRAYRVQNRIAHRGKGLPRG